MATSKDWICLKCPPSERQVEWDNDEKHRDLVPKKEINSFTWFHFQSQGCKAWCGADSAQGDSIWMCPKTGLDPQIHWYCHHLLCQLPFWGDPYFRHTQQEIPVAIA